ncbi:septin CDC12 [Ascoidea rubescens DSM 1968]|uniref:Septin n=1 Tax=Ascoidea rubescens DSM 1968 TaxID=1344418 RepID=A0A1D2VKW7_9ASCO|nr:Septin [Ascoidea rubescens DSM 1968]ODV62249.1 Septin [Ascoidea rubescens DSM 1968]
MASAATASPELQYSELVGIDNLPIQRYKIVSKKGATFTLMVAGESGLGKTTFINTLFQTSLKNHIENSARHQKGIHATVEIDVVRAELEEKNFKIRLNVIDTPGFGDNINNKNSYQSLIDFIDDQHDSYMKQEQQPSRNNIHDLRVHACLYFIRPTGHSLKPLDIECMKKLCTRVNLIPVIAKADTLSPKEMSDFKQRIRAVIEAQDIKIYSPPIDLDDQTSAEHAKDLIQLMPFAIIGSESLVKNLKGDLIIGRKFPWGIAEVENSSHCDFLKLRSLLLRTNMLDLILSTEELHYESYRAFKMEEQKSLSSNSDSNNDSIPPIVPTSNSINQRLQNNPLFRKDEEQLKNYFTEKVKTEESRFRQWEQNIVNERNRLNKDLEAVQQQIKELQDQIKELSVKKK